MCSERYQCEKNATRLHSGKRCKTLSAFFFLPLFFFVAQYVCKFFNLRSYIYAFLCAFLFLYRVCVLVFLLSMNGRGRKKFQHIHMSRGHLKISSPSDVMKRRKFLNWHSLLHIHIGDAGYRMIFGLTFNVLC
jgi:hypothetical protein